MVEKAPSKIKITRVQNGYIATSMDTLDYEGDSSEPPIFVFASFGELVSKMAEWFDVPTTGTQVTASGGSPHPLSNHSPLGHGSKDTSPGAIAAEAQLDTGEKPPESDLPCLSTGMSGDKDMTMKKCTLNRHHVAPHSWEGVHRPPPPSPAG